MELLERKVVAVHKHQITNKHRFTGFILIGLAVYILSNIVDEWRAYQGATVAVFVVAIASVILLTGYSGQISLGHGALLAIGAYTAALTQIYFGAPIWICFIAAVGGEQGISFDAGWPPLSLGETFTQYKWFLWIATLAALISMWWVQNILRSRYGRSWRAVKTNEVAAELAGVHLGRSKVLAFTVSAGIAGLAGALLAMTVNNVSPSAFPLALSFSIATGAVLSGVNTLGGVMIGSVALVAIPLIATSISDRWSGSGNLATLLPEFIVSALLILTVFLAPKGPIEKLRSRHSK
jgi:branched-chain amino acid transport system permease protein